MTRGPGRPRWDPGESVLRDLARRYDEGETFEELSLDTGVSEVTLRKRLRSYITPRPPGQRPGTSPQQRADAAAAPSGSIPRVASKTQRTGHRRRGGIL